MEAFGETEGTRKDPVEHLQRVFGVTTLVSHTSLAEKVPGGYTGYTTVDGLCVYTKSL